LYAACAQLKLLHNKRPLGAIYKQEEVPLHGVLVNHQAFAMMIMMMLAGSLPVLVNHQAFAMMIMMLAGSLPVNKHFSDHCLWIALPSQKPQRNFKQHPAAQVKAHLKPQAHPALPKLTSKKNAQPA